MLYPKEFTRLTEDEIYYDGSGFSDWKGWQKALFITGIVAASIGTIYVGARFASSNKFQPSSTVINEGVAVNKLKAGSVPVGPTGSQPNYCKYDGVFWAPEGYFD